jgi:hypothetical protein
MKRTVIFWAVMQCNSPEDHSSHLLHEGSLTCRFSWNLTFKYKVVQIWPGLMCVNKLHKSRSYLNHLVFFWKSVMKIQVWLKLTRIMGTWHEDRRTFIIISYLVLKMRHVSDTRCSENQNRHFIFNNFLPKIMQFSSEYGDFCMQGSGSY